MQSAQFASSPQSKHWVCAWQLMIWCGLFIARANKTLPHRYLKSGQFFYLRYPAKPRRPRHYGSKYALGRTLSLTVIAEGVETKEQEAFLRDHKCDQSQGYYFSKPISPEDFVSFMKKQAASTIVYPPFASPK